MDNTIKLHDTLNQDLWDGERLKPDVKDALTKIAEEFVKFLKIDVSPDDVVILGSNANYNYTQHSDIDLHVLIDFSKVNDDAAFTKEYFDSKKFIWNSVHNIKIYGYAIEMYVQDINETNASTAVYSITKDAWLVKPKKEVPDIDKHSVLLKVQDIISKIESAKGDLGALNLIKDKIKHMRQSGLEKHGEYSVENVAFKTLRSGGYIKKLIDAAKELYDKNLSLKEVHGAEWDEFANSEPAQTSINEISSEDREKIKKMKSYGAEFTPDGSRVILYHGTNTAFKPDNLRYNSYLSSSPAKEDSTGNSGAGDYGKYVYKYILPLSHVEVLGSGEFLYKGNPVGSKKTKYPSALYKAYADYYGYTFSISEMDSEDYDRFRSIASQALSDGTDEFDELMKRHKSAK